MMTSNHFMVERKTKGSIVTENSGKYDKTNSGSEKRSLKTVDESVFLYTERRKRRNTSKNEKRFSTASDSMTSTNADISETTEESAI